MARIIFIVFALLTAGASYATYYGIGAESRDAVTSVRAGSGGYTRIYSGK